MTKWTQPALRGRYHWFDGDGMVHPTAFENGRARDRNRYVRTKAFTQEEAAGRARSTRSAATSRPTPRPTSAPAS